MKTVNELARKKNFMLYLSLANLIFFFIPIVKVWNDSLKLRINNNIFKILTAKNSSFWAVLIVILGIAGLIIHFIPQLKAHKQKLLVVIPIAEIICMIGIAIKYFGEDDDDYIKATFMYWIFIIFLAFMALCAISLINDKGVDKTNG